MIKVLYLSVWYPNKKDQMAGLFVKKHAEAARKQGVDVRVNTFWTKADLVQLNVLTIKMGLVAYVLKRLWGIPYIVMEHWTGYMPQNGQYMRLPRWKRAIIAFLASEAEAVYTVSELLEQSMQACGIRAKHWGHVDNIVEACFYQPYVRAPHEQVQLLHVSCFLERAKNIKGLLRAMKQISLCREDWRLTLVGNGPDWQECVDYARALSIPEHLIVWTGELAPEQVCSYMQASDVMVLGSRYETYGIPLAEAIVVGIPAIETDACGLRLPDECGLSVPIDDDAAIEQAVRYMLDHHAQYDAKRIQSYRNCFTEQAVGEQLKHIYQFILNH